jgi:hypothetical protein
MSPMGHTLRPDCAFWRGRWALTEQGVSKSASRCQGFPQVSRLTRRRAGNAQALQRGSTVTHRGIQTCVDAVLG